MEDKFKNIKATPEDSLVKNATGYFGNCVIDPRDGEETTVYEEKENGEVIIRLDGYYIMPIEKAKRLIPGL